ncbi:Hemicentin-2 [Labeo rohita]|uniref:Hemicentin-2 n=1 Tax=Labeo rohita TaxID=84645 RepID=A0ABQ8L184_LABRO|nr:Hemicentin-2 [Labeo rohita]
MNLNNEKPKAEVTIKPAQHVFRGDTATLRCDINGEGVTKTLWHKEGLTSVFSELQEHTFSSVNESDAGKYTCYGSNGSDWSQISDAVTLTVSVLGFLVKDWTLCGFLKAEIGSQIAREQSTCFESLGFPGRSFLWGCHAMNERLEPEDSRDERINSFSGSHCVERPKPKVTIKPAQHVFRGDAVTLRCDINHEGVTSWSYSWYKEGSTSVFSDRQEHTFSPVKKSYAGKYSCKGSETEGSRWSQMSDAVTLRVSDPRAVLSVSPQKWLTEGDPVTLICEVYSFSTGWTFSWFTLTVSADNSHHYNLLSDSSRGAGGNYTVSSAALNHTGVYSCRAEREKPAYKTQYSNTQLLWVTGVSPPVSLIVGSSRTQHFTSVSLSLSCEDQSNSDRWRVRRYTDGGRLEDCSSLHRGSQTGSTCTISSTNTSDTGVYWCESESEAKYHSVNITVHLSGVILESPVHPVTEGDHLILHCLYQHTTSPNLRADFYKDGSLIQNQTTEMSITTVSKSHEGFYYCKHPERGESPKSWISVRRASNDHCLFHSESQICFLNILSSVLTVCPYLLVTVMLIFKCGRMRERRIPAPPDSRLPAKLQDSAGT